MHRRVTPPPRQRRTPKPALAGPDLGAEIEMNHSKTIFLVNDKVRAILATYEEDQPNNPAKATIFKTLDSTIEPGDIVVVGTNVRHRATVVRVKEVDVPVDFDLPDIVDWVIGKVDLDRHKELLANELAIIHKARLGEMNRKRAQLASDMLGDDVKSLRNMPLVSLPEPNKH